MISEEFARTILQHCIDEDRCAELLICLFEGGSVTIDKHSGHIIFATAEQLAELAGDVVDA